MTIGWPESTHSVTSLLHGDPVSSYPQRVYGRWRTKAVKGTLLVPTWRPSAMVAGQSGGVRYSSCYAANTYGSINKIVCCGRPSIRMWPAASSAELEAEIAGMEFEIKYNFGRHWTCPSSFLFDDPGNNQGFTQPTIPPTPCIVQETTKFHSTQVRDLISFVGVGV